MHNYLCMSAQCSGSTSKYIARIMYRPIQIGVLLTFCAFSFACFYF